MSAADVERRAVELDRSEHGAVRVNRDERVVEDFARGLAKLSKLVQGVFTSAVT